MKGKESWFFILCKREKNNIIDQESGIMSAICLGYTSKLIRKYADILRIIFDWDGLKTGLEDVWQTFYR